MKLKLGVKELAEIVGLSSRTIRYYDQIGLFLPSGTDSNGYRYYAIEKIEELRLIQYLRYLDIPIAEIRDHLESREINEYSALLRRQLEATRQKIEKLNFIERRLEKRMASVEYLNHLPKPDEITVTWHKKRKIIHLMTPISEPLDWEIAMLKFERQDNMPPSLFIGDIGFITDLSRLSDRHPTEFIGLYMDAEADNAQLTDSSDYLPEGHWLKVYFSGDHFDAPNYYEKLLEYAENHQLTLAKTAYERVLIDHYISSDPVHNLTEIQIHILST